MAEFDLTKQMEEAAKERSNIAKTLLAIQQSLDKLAPTMLKMEPVLASLEPAVNNLSAWRPRVDAAVGQLPNDLSDTRKQLEKIALAPFRTSKASDPSSSTAVDARTPATCSIKVPDHNTGDEDPGVMSLLPGSTPTSLISSPEDSPSPPLVALEVTTLPSTTCSAKCSSSIIGSPASAFRITHATPTWLLPAPASMLGPELWPAQPCWLFVVLELDTKSSSRCSTTCLINNTELFMYMPMADVIQSIMRPRQGLRPRPWPSFTSDNTAHDPTAYLGESAGTDEAEYTWKPLFGTQGNSQTNVFIPLGETRGNKGRWLSCSGSMTFNWYPQEEFAEILPVTTSSRVLQVRVGPCRQLTSEVCEEVFLLQPKLPQSPLLISRVVAVQNPVYTMINLCVRFVYGLQLQLGSDTISNMEVSLEYVYNKCFIFQSSAGLKFDVDFRGYLTTVLVDNNTLSCSLLCLSSAYASHGNNSTIQSNSALLQWEIAWFSWMGALHPELLWCILGQENGGKDGAHMTYVGGLASTVLSTQCSVSAYHDGLGDQCNGGFLSKITSALANRHFLVVLLPLDPSDFVTVTSDVWVLERLHSKIVKCLLVYLTVQQTVSIAQAETISSLRFFWDTCGSLQAAQKRMKIKKPPNILVFNLRQFTYIEQLGRYKNLAYQVALPLEHKLVNIVDHSDLESSVLAGQPIPCAFKLNQWNIASILDWDCYASTSDLHAVLLDTAVQLQSAAPSSDHSGGYLALLRLLALRPVQIAAEVCDSKSNSFASVVLLFGHKRSMSKQGMEQARAIFDALPSPQRHRTGTSMQGLAIGSVLKICRRVATPSFLMAGLLATRIQLMYFCQAVCLSEEIARETAISTEDFSINQVDIRHKYDCLVLKEKTRTKSLLELTVTMLTSRGNAGTMWFTDTSVHWPFLRKEEFEGIGNYSGDGMIVPQSAKGIAQPCYMVEFGYTTNSSSCVNCRNKYIVDVNLSAHSVGEIVSLKLIQIGVVLSLGSKSCCGGPLEQLWDPGGNNSSVLLSSSLDEIALYRRILIDGQNPVDTLQLLSSCELAPFQGGRRIIVSAFVDHDYYLNAFVDKILFIHANYQVQACTDHDDHLDFVQAHLNHYYYQEGYHGDLGGTKKHPTPWDPGGCSPMSAWGQAEFEGGGNVTGITQQAHNEMPRPAHKAQVESDLIYIEECIASGGDHRWITELAAPLGVYLPPTPWLYISIPFLAATNSIPMYQ